MINRIRGLLRDAWWLLAVILAGAAVVGATVTPFVGLVVAVGGSGSFVYFAVMRYDDEGRERGPLE